MDVLPATTCSYYSPISNIQIFLLMTVILLSFLAHYLWRKHSLPVAYVDCMVDTYFYGYLKKIIPDNGKGGLKDRIMNYKTIQGLSNEMFPFTKMFIIITPSGFIPSVLDAFDRDGRIELRQDMNPEVLSRAGVADRIYKTSIYKIKFRGESKHFTVVMEGAPPVVCLYETCKENQGLMKHKKEMIHMFYTKLRNKIKENLEFEDACELIFFDDLEGKKSLADEMILKYLDTSELTA